MSRNSRKEKEKELRKNYIIDAAERLFFSKGYKNTTMKEIAEEAEFSKRTLYVYFDSKQQLYFAIVIRAYDKLISLNKNILKNNIQKTGLEKVKIMGRNFITFARENPNYFKSIAYYENQEEDFNTDDEVIKECYNKGEELLQFLFNSIREGIKDQSIRKNIDLEKTAIILWSSIMGLINLITIKEKYLRHYHNQYPEPLIEELFKLIENALKK